MAFPVQRERPFPLMPVFCFARISEIEGKSYAIFKFNVEGFPIL